MSAAIVVRTPNWLGDTVMALPMLAALRAAEPAARITLVGRWATLLAGQGVADVALPYPKPLALRRRLARALAAERADVAVLLPSSIEAALAAWRWRAARRVGYATDGRAPLLTDALPLPAPRLHQVDEYAALLTPLGVSASRRRPRGRPPARATTRGWTRRSRGSWPTPASGPTRASSASTWARPSAAPSSGRGGLRPPRATARRGRAHARSCWAPADDADTAAAVLRAAGGPIASLVGRDRPALLPRLLARLRCLVSGDTGVAHLAAAVDVATVTLFGPTDRRLTAPRGPPSRTLDRAAPCAPCFLPRCPIDHVCLTRSTGEVLHEVRQAVA